MTASEILNLAGTVATVQIICDGIANWRIYSQEPYQRALGALSRSKAKLERERVAVGKESAKVGAATSTSNSKKQKADRLAKRLQRAEDDYAEARGNVARKHVAPGFISAVIFMIILRILGTEHKGNVMGILPFTPFSLIKRLTARGLEFDPQLSFEPVSEKVTDVGQACSFMFIYFLCTFSIKYYAGRIFGTKPPAGTEGLMSIMDSPAG